jgi:hypothetical protein
MKYTRIAYDLAGGRWEVWEPSTLLAVGRIDERE